MSKLLIYIGENQSFVFNDTVAAITEIAGVSHGPSGKFIGAVFECEYSYAGRTTVVRLTDDLETVTIEGLGVESADFAVKFQQHMAIPLHIIDMEYSFDLLLSEFQSGTELLLAINQS